MELEVEKGMLEVIFSPRETIVDTFDLWYMSKPKTAWPKA